jgi:hypothetical protein
MAGSQIDLTKQYRELYAPLREPSLVDVPELSFLMIDGHGDPNVSAAYGQAVEALYSVSFTIKFGLKRGPRQVDYRVMPLEGLWWVPDMSQFSVERKSDWDWTMMIRQPDELDKDAYEQAIAESTRKKELPAARLLRFERFAEQCRVVSAG